MEKEMRNIYFEGLSFFGQTNRLISHELKNILAIISETLGLMDELRKLSETGTALEPGKIRSLSESIIEEVERANKIIRNMNAFAHSVDEFIGDVDIGQTLTLVVELCQLESSARKTSIRLMDSKPYLVSTIPIFLENLIYYVLDDSLRLVDKDNEIRISFDSNDHGIRITFSGLVPDIIFGEFPNKKEELLAKALCAQVLRDASAGEMHIVLPNRMEESLMNKTE